RSDTLESSGKGKKVGLDRRDGYPGFGGPLVRRLVCDRLSAHCSVRIKGPSSVMATVCSYWADRLPSTVRAVQPSSSILTRSSPVFNIGSMVITIPGFRGTP